MSGNNNETARAKPTINVMTGVAIFMPRGTHQRPPEVQRFRRTYGKSLNTRLAARLSRVPPAAGMVAFVEPLAVDDPRQVGGFRLQARLGAGGMGRVYLGYSPGGRPVAVKVVHPDLARDPEFMQRFRREVAAAQAVSDAYTAAVVGAGPDDSPPWLATTFVPGSAAGRPGRPVRAAGRGRGVAAGRRPGRGAAGDPRRGADPPRPQAGQHPHRRRRAARHRLRHLPDDERHRGHRDPARRSAPPPTCRPSRPKATRRAVERHLLARQRARVRRDRRRRRSAAARCSRSASGSCTASRTSAGVPASLRPLIDACLAKDPAARPALGQLMETVAAGVRGLPGGHAGEVLARPGGRRAGVRHVHADAAAPHHGPGAQPGDSGGPAGSAGRPSRPVHAGGAGPGGCPSAPPPLAAARRPGHRGGRRGRDRHRAGRQSAAKSPDLPARGKRLGDGDGDGRPRVTGPAATARRAAGLAL